MKTEFKLVASEIRKHRGFSGKAYARIYRGRVIKLIPILDGGTPESKDIYKMEIGAVDNNIFTISSEVKHDYISHK